MLSATGHNPALTDAYLIASAGTSIQHTGQRMSRDVFMQHIKPALDAHPDMFPGMGYEAFEYAAGMVQSRSFSINEENFITGESTEGRAASLPTCIRQPI